MQDGTLGITPLKGQTEEPEKGSEKERLKDAERQEDTKTLESSFKKDELIYSVKYRRGLVR